MSKRIYGDDLYDRIDLSSTVEIADAVTGGNAGSIGIIRKAVAFRNGDNVEIQIDLRNIDTTGLTAGNDLWIRGLRFTPETNDTAVGTAYVAPTTFTGKPNAYHVAGDYAARLIDSTGSGALIVSEVSSGVTDIFATWSFAANPADFF